jgi:hypothetical protein
MTINVEKIYMNVYEIGIRGGLKRTIKPIFNEENVILVDDGSNIYLWFGKKVTEKRRNLSIHKAESLNMDKDKLINIQMLNQNQEYGAFLNIIDLLTKEKGKDIEKKRRPELQIEYDSTLELLEAGLVPDLEAKITIASHSISKEKKSYDDLCSTLAKLQLSFVKNKSKITKEEIKLKTREIFASSSTYEELCWLIAELTVLKEKKELK